MKWYLFSFLFFISVTLFSSTTLEGRFLDYPIAKVDSITLYYTASMNRKLSLSDRLAFINKAMQIARLNEKDSLFLLALAYKSKIYGQFKSYDLAITQATVLEKEAMLRDRPLFKALAYNKMGYYQGKKNNITLNYKWYRRSLDLYKEHNDNLNVIVMTKRLGNLLNNQGAYIDAEKLVVEALPYGKSIKDKSELSWLYDILAIGKRNTQQYDDAIKFHKQSIEYETSFKSSLSLKNNLGVTLIKEGSYEEAIHLYKDLLQEDTLLTEKSKARFLDNYGFAKSKFGHIESENILLEALSLRRKTQDGQGQIASHMHLAQFYKKQGDSNASQFHAQSALDFANGLNSPEGRLEALTYIIPYQPGLFEEYSHLKDSITTANASNRNSFAKLRYDYSEAEKLKNDALLAQEKSNSKMRLAVLGFLVLGLMSGFVFYYQRLLGKKQKREERYMTESRLSKKVHDELANDVFGLRSELEITTVSKHILEKVDQIYERTRNISKEHKTIDIGSTFFESLIFMLRGTLNQEVKLILRGTENISWLKISKHTKRVLYRSMQELMVNLEKHSNASVVVIAFAKEKKGIHITYNDNGNGKTIDFINRSGSGLQNVESRISELKGSFTFEKEKSAGFSAQIYLPV